MPAVMIIQTTEKSKQTKKPGLKGEQKTVNIHVGVLETAQQNRVLFEKIDKYTCIFFHFNFVHMCVPLWESGQPVAVCSLLPSLKVYRIGI